MSWIVNVNSGSPISIGTFSTGAGRHSIFANGTPDVVGPFDIKGKVAFPAGSSSGSYFMDGNLAQLTDPQCANVTTSKTLEPHVRSCGRGFKNTNQILLQNPAPGVRGTLGFSSLQGPGRWRFDASAAKSVSLARGKPCQFRMDITNVFNHPEPNVSTALNSAMMNINAANFGVISGASAKTSLHRQLQAQLKFEF